EIVLMTGVTSPGCGNETGIAQIVADELGVSPDDIEVVQGDTDVCPFGLGNSSSRSVIFGGNAAKLAANDLRQKMTRVAARMLEVGPEDIEVGSSRFAVRGAPTRFVAFADRACKTYRDAFSLPLCAHDPGPPATARSHHRN